MSEPTKESTLVSHIVKAIRAEHPGTLVWKIHGGPMQEVGIPDLIACHDGVLVGIEVKLRRPGESDAALARRVTQHQQRQLARIREAGGRAGVATTVGEALLILTEGGSHRPQVDTYVM